MENTFPSPRSRQVIVLVEGTKEYPKKIGRRVNVFDGDSKTESEDGEANRGALENLFFKFPRVIAWKSKEKSENIRSTAKARVRERATILSLSFGGENDRDDVVEDKNVCIVQKEGKLG